MLLFYTNIHITSNLILYITIMKCCDEVKAESMNYTVSWPEVLNVMNCVFLLFKPFVHCMWTGIVTHQYHRYMLLYFGFPLLWGYTTHHTSKALTHSEGYNVYWTWCSYLLLYWSVYDEWFAMYRIQTDNHCCKLNPSPWPRCKYT